MVDLTELAWALAIKIYDEASTKVVLNFDHVASHLNCLTGNQFFGHQPEH